MAQIFDIGNRYLQREETVHLAVELIDRIFLNEDGWQGPEFSNKVNIPSNEDEMIEFELSRIR
jgi:hypothetical protein